MKFDLKVSYCSPEYGENQGIRGGVSMTALGVALIVCAMEGMLIVGIASELRKEEKKLKEIQRSTEVFSSDRKLSVFKIEEDAE